MEKFLNKNGAWIARLVGAGLAVIAWYYIQRLDQKIDRIEYNISEVREKVARIEGTLERKMEVVKWVNGR